MPTGAAADPYTVSSVIDDAPRTAALPDRLDEADCRRLARLHVASLPDTAIGRLGSRYAERFYRYVARSGDEHAFVHREAGTIEAACILSLAPESLTRRLWRHTSLALAVVRAFPHASVRALWGALRPGAGSMVTGSAEVIVLFTRAECRETGLASALLRRCEAYLAASGYEGYCVRAVADPASRAAEFYLKRGFTPCAAEGPTRIWRKRIG